RYYCRYYLMGTLGATDHLMFTALVITWGNTVINYYQDISSRKSRPSQFRKPEKQAAALKGLEGVLITWWVYRYTYSIGLCFVKLSILYFYKAIATNRTFRRLVHTTIVLICLFTLAATMASIFQCENPVDAFSTDAFMAQFDRGARKNTAKCFNPTKLWVTTAAVNLFTDVVILMLPIPTLLSLRVPINKRLALVGIFSVGIMAIVASCVRMWVMALWGESPQNSVKFGSDLLLWGQVETNSGIISASVPFLRLIFKGRDRADEDKRPVISPPKAQPSPVDEKPVEIASMAFFSGPGDAPAGSPMWKPFITVPASLS
ncbi:hypothetical protein EJ04DRAFT_414820, partial [Polyplosphaeria fusca]